MTDLEQVDADLAQAWAALCGARAVANRTPTGETLRVEGVAQDRVDWLLDKRLRLMGRQKVGA